MSSTRMYTKDNCSVFTVGSNSLLTYLGRAEVRGRTEWLENNALCDAWQHGVAGRKGLEVSVELAGDTAQVVNAMKTWAAGSAVSLTITTDEETITGSFAPTEGSVLFEDAIRYNITLQSVGEVTVS